MKLKKNFRLHSSLLRNLNEEKKEIIEDSFKAARSFLNLLSDKLDAKLEDKIKESEASFNYEESNWSAKQAHLFGYRQALRDMISLFVDNKSKDK